jgi:predicted metal-binding protein
MTTEDREALLKVLHAHERTIAVCEACAATTRDLASEVARGGIPTRDDLVKTIDEAERVLTELTSVRREVERLIMALA